MTNTISLRTSTEHNYKYLIGSDLDFLAQYINTHYDINNAFIIIDERVESLHGQRIRSAFENVGIELLSQKVPQGETSKSLEQYTQLCDFLLSNKIRRGSPIVAIGGGVTGDLAGFAAATVLRGVPLIHVPTTLLAMVDSSLGGKTGVNFETGKNVIGSFYQPDLVLADIDFLRTLPDEEWINGMSEMIKYAAISRTEMFDELADLAKNMGFIPTEKWAQLITKSAQVKADIVEQDVKEAGIRAWLNFGHTFGHALEKVSEYGKISHGEAVYVGMLAETYYSRKVGNAIETDKLEQFISYYNPDLSVKPHDKTGISALIEAMKYDKKIKKEKIRLVLLKNYGNPYLHCVEDHKLLADAWHFALSAIRS